MTDEEKFELEASIHQGKSAARSQTRARILLKAAAGLQDKDIIKALEVSPSMVAKTRPRCVEEGSEAALKDRPRPTQQPDKQAAHLIAIACSDAPEGHGHWTLRLLVDKVVALSYAASCRHEMIRQLLKNTLKPWRKQEWCIPEVSAEFMVAMEEVLDLYEGPYRSKSCLSMKNRGLMILRTSGFQV